MESWIDTQLKNTSVTVVLIGSETSNREFVRYEVRESYKKGNGIIGVYVHGLRDRNGNVSLKGNAEFGQIGIDAYGRAVYFEDIADTYDYVLNRGYNNMGEWIE